MKITIVGLGLIGGSIAKSLSLSGKHDIYAMDKDEQVLLDAMSSGVINDKANYKDLSTSDVVYLCMYPEGIIDFVNAYKHLFGKNTIITDVCGIKNGVYYKIKEASDEFGFTYIGAHPMAGKEISSFSASDASLYFGASYIVIKDESPKEKFDIVEALAYEMGFGRIVYSTPEEHDKMIAYTSQVPHVLACAYVMSPQCERHSGFSAGSYRDVSRVARINAKMWTDLFLSNQQALVDELDTLSDNITKIKNAVKSGDSKELERLLQKARDIKETFG